MINKVKAIVKDRILTTLGTILIVVGAGLLVYSILSDKAEISDTKLIILFIVGGGFIIAPEKILERFKNKI